LDPPSREAPADTYRFGIKISSETTRLTEPLLPNGAPDYAAAMNLTTGMGVTPSNNAVQLLTPALGLTFSKKIRDRLDLPEGPSASTARPLVGGFSREAFEELVRARPEVPPPADLDSAWKALLAEQQVLRDGYCSSKACPGIADWLRVNEAPLAAVTQASRKQRYWIPMEDGANLYQTRSKGGESEGRFGTVCTALSARAQLRLGDGEAAGASEDILTVHRLAVLLGQSAILGDQLVAARCIEEGNEALRRLATAPIRDRASAANLLKGLDPLSQIGNFELVVQHERFVALAGIFLLRELAETKGTAAWREVLDGQVGAPADSRPEGFYRLTISAIDWNLAVRQVNESWDLVHDLVWSPDASREEVRKRLQEGMRWTEETKAALEEPGLSQSLQNVDRDAAARPRLTRAFVDAAGLLPRDVSRFLRAVNEPLAGRELGLLALALSLHRAERGKLPASVDALVPGYLERIPPARQFGHVLRVASGDSPELALTLVPEIAGVTGSASYCLDTEGRNFILPDGTEPKVVEGRCQPPGKPPDNPGN
jgi:hypothetical protein